MAIAAADRVSPRLAAELAVRAFTTPVRRRRPDHEGELLDTGEPFTVRAGGTEIAAWRWGDGPVVLLVHGWAGRGAQLGALVPVLTALGRSVVTFDAPAHGDSPGTRSTLAAMASVIRSVADAVGPLDAVIAHSFGAAATTLALTRGLQTRRVAFIAPMFDVPAGVGRFMSLLGLSPPARDAFLEELTLVNLATAADLDGAVLAAGQTAPLLVVHDRDDHEVPYADGVAAATLWPDGRLITTAGLGHQRVLRDPTVIAAVRDFVAGARVDATLLDEGTRLERELADREGRRARAFPH